MEKQPGYISFLRRYWRLLFAALLLLLALVAAWGQPFVPEMFFEQHHEPPEPEELDPDDIVEIDGGLLAHKNTFTEAVTILVGEHALCTLSNAEEAQTLLSEIMSNASQAFSGDAPVAEITFAQPVALRNAVVGENAEPLEDVRLRLRENPALCPVRVITREIQREEIPFAQDTQEDARLVKGARLVLQAGKAGERTIALEQSYLNGIAEGPLLERALEERAPIDARVAIGSAAPKKAEGEPGKEEGVQGKDAPFTLKAPIKGEIVSNFGMRAHLMHNGLDYEAPPGEVVCAPGGGTVLFAGVRASYGFVVDIDLGGGFIARLAPLSECALAVGDVVEAGQEIAVLAKPMDDEITPHLHMELLIDGVPYNPRPYLD